MSGVQQRLESAHDNLCRASGKLSLMLVRHKLSRSMMAQVLELVGEAQRELQALNNTERRVPPQQVGD